jgi:N-acyl amino acid synthase of PEP-CTERM/exosortase system
LNDGLYGLAYRRDFDPEADDTKPVAPIPEVANDRRSKPEIILGLYKALYHESKRKGVTHWFVAMEKTLLRLLHRFNFDFTPIGPELDYYGPVVPYIAEVAEIEQTVFRNNPELFLDFIAGLEDEFLPAFARDFRKNH